MSPALLNDYISRGGSDLGEFLMGSEGRRSIEPAPEQMLGDFPGVMAQTGGKFSLLSKALGMKGDSLKRIIREGRVATGDVMVKLETALEIAPGTKADGQFWALARGDKTVGTARAIVDEARKALEKPEANAQAIARGAALKLIAHSGYTHEKLGELTGSPGMMKEIIRSEGYQFSPERAVLFANAMVPGQREILEPMANMLMGFAKELHVPTLVKQVNDGEIKFNDLMRRVREQKRRQTREEFTASFNEFTAARNIAQKATTPMVAKWEEGKVPVQTREQADALAAFLEVPADQKGIVPCVVANVQTRNEEWLVKIRSGEVLFKDYLHTVLEEKGLSQEAFCKLLPHGPEEDHVGHDTLRGWLRGKQVNARHARLLADWAGFTEGHDRDDFMAFARTGKLQRNDVRDMVTQLLRDKLPLAEFVYRLRVENGESPEEFDHRTKMHEGATRHIEQGRALHRENAVSLAGYLHILQPEAQGAFCSVVMRKGDASEFNKGVDPEGYRGLLEAMLRQCEVQNLESLRAKTADIRFAFPDAEMENGWRALADDHGTKYVSAGARVPQYLTDGWNDLHDLLFSTVNPARLTSKRFKENIEGVISYIANRDDEGTARRFMTASIMRAHAVPSDKAQHTALIETAGLLNMKFIHSFVDRVGARQGGGLDLADAKESAEDKIKRAINNGTLKSFPAMDSYFRTTISNAMLNERRKGKRRARSLPGEEDSLENRPEASVRDADSMANTPEQVLTSLVKFRSGLSVKDRELLDAIVNNHDQPNMQVAVAEELDIPVGTVKSRTAHLRSCLTGIPELRDMLEDVFGDHYVGEMVSRYGVKAPAKNDEKPGRS